MHIELIIVHKFQITSPAFNIYTLTSVITNYKEREMQFEQIKPRRNNRPYQKS